MVYIYTCVCVIASIAANIANIAMPLLLYWRLFHRVKLLMQYIQIFYGRRMRLVPIVSPLLIEPGRAVYILMDTSTRPGLLLFKHKIYD